MNPAASAASPAYRHSVLALLLLAYVLSFIDRNIMAVLVTPIREDLAISDFQFSLLHGFAFAFFYTLLGLPIARLADRSNRVRIIALGVLFWSVMTAFCGLARQYATLFIARMGVGLGEAALSPASHSLLSDYYPRRQLPMVMAVYTLGIPLGGGLAYSIGGAVYEYFARQGGLLLPGLGLIRPWQVTFLVVGLPGVLLAAVLALLREPPRQGRLQPEAAAIPLRQVLHFLHRHRRVYGLGFAGIALLSILGYGILTWLVAFLQRSHAMGLGEAARLFGQVYVFAGSAGVLLGGVYASWLQRRQADASLRTVLHVAWLLVLPAVAMPLMPTPWLCLLWLVPLVFLLNAYFGVAIAAFQLVTPNELRAQVSAVLLFVTNMAGLALGPALVAAMTDFLFADDMALRYSLALLGLLAAPLAAWLVAAALPAYRRMLPL